MKANEIKIETGSKMLTIEQGKQYNFYIALGRLFPTTKQQSKAFIKSQKKFDVLSGAAVNQIEALFNEFGECGEYVYTKSKQWVRLRYDQYDKLYDCLKKKYGI